MSAGHGRMAKEHLRALYTHGPILAKCSRQQPERAGGNRRMKQVEVGVIGTGWCGGIRAETLAANPLVAKLHIAETREERLAEMKAATNPATATSDYRELIVNPDIDAIYVCATPETSHYPMAREALLAGKHVFLEKPIALELWEADELVELARRRNLKFTIGYSQRFNPKFAYAKKKFTDGTLGEPVSVLVSRHITRNLGRKISGRIKLSPAAMEATHDLDFAFWLLEPAKPVRVYAQGVNRVMHPTTGLPDIQFITVTMDNGVVVMIGAGWILPPAYPNFSHTWIEIVGSEGALMIDDSHKDVALSTLQGGTVFPMSTMPGEKVDHVYAGSMAPETNHFLEAVAFDRPVMVTPESARTVMEVYLAADISTETGEPVTLPLGNEARAKIAAGGAR
jgi:predicted dehydrogenase